MALEVKNPPASTGEARDMGLRPGPGRSRRERNDNLLQCFSLENSMDRGAWQATVYSHRESDMTEQTQALTCTQ